MAMYIEEYYRSARYVMTREYGLAPNELPLRGSWVIRDIKTGNLIDWSKYSNDLLDKYPELAE